MSLPPIYTRTRFSLSLCRPQDLPINVASKEALPHQPKIPIIKQGKKLKPELIITKALDPFFSSPSIEHLKLPGQRLSPVSPTSNLYQKVKKSSYLKRDFLDSNKDRASEISVGYTKPIRDYFDGSIPVHRSFLDNLVKKEEKARVESKNERKLTPVERFRAEKIMLEPLKQKEEEGKKKVGNSKRYVPEARSSFKKTKIEVSYSKYINENLQTDWNSFNLEEWELDPYA